METCPLVTRDLLLSPAVAPFPQGRTISFPSSSKTDCRRRLVLCNCRARLGEGEGRAISKPSSVTQELRLFSAAVVVDGGAGVAEEDTGSEN